MPLYTYHCPSCSSTFDVMRKLADYAAPQECGCGAWADKILQPTAIRMDYQGYSCPVTGTWIEGKRAHEENLRKHGCRVLEPGENEAAKRSEVEEESKLEAALDRTTDQFIAELPVDKRVQLVNEIAAGATATVTRQ